MKRTIEVHIGDTPQRVGLLQYNREGARESAIFEYHAEWLRAIVHLGRSPPSEVPRPSPA